MKLRHPCSRHGHATQGRGEHHQRVGNERPARPSVLNLENVRRLATQQHFRCISVCLKAQTSPIIATGWRVVSLFGVRKATVADGQHAGKV